MFLLIEFCCGTPPSCLKVIGWVGGGLEQFSVSPRPLSFGFGTKRFGAKGLGPGLDNFMILTGSYMHLLMVDTTLSYNQKSSFAS